MTFKEFKTKIRKKIGLVGLAEFTDDSVKSNSVENWNNLFNNKKFLKSYLVSDRILFYNELVSIVKQNIDLNNIDALIDVGCGTGHLLNEIHSQNNKIELYGSDFSEKALEIGKQLLPKANFINFDLYNIPLNLNEKFDIVICTEVLEHLLYPDIAIKNLISLIKKKKGTLILSVPNGRIDNSEIHINFWSPDSWKIFIENNCKDAVIEYFLIENKMVNLAIIKF